MRIVTAAEMRACDEHTFRHVGVPSRAVMEAAGRSVAEVVLSLPREAFADGVTVYTGSGNNAGDGFVVARALVQLGIPVEVLTLVPPASLKGDAAVAMTAWRASGGALAAATPESVRDRNSRTRAPLSIDAIFGTGYSRAMDQEHHAVVEQINHLRAAELIRTLAVDIPSGVFADTGDVPTIAVRADWTVALQCLKPCHVLPPARELCGEVFVTEIGVSLDALPVGLPGRQLLDIADSKAILRKIRHSPFVHKGTRGHVAVLGGFPGKTGAVSLSAHAALRAGAGLATALVPESSFAALESKLHEVMGVSIPLSNGEPTARAVLTEALARVDALVVGPGLGTGDESRMLLHLALDEAKQRQLPLLLDADALNIIAHDAVVRALIPGGSVLTPHPGEMGRLRRKSAADIEGARFAEAQSVAAELHSVVVLKGANTVISGADGELWVSAHSQASLATGGSGDVLAGIISAYLASGLAPVDAAQLGVFIHAEAGAFLSRGVVGGGVGALAHEIADAVPRLSTALLEAEERRSFSFAHRVLPPQPVVPN